MPKTIFTGANQVVVETVRDARLRAGMRQVELGNRLGKDQSWVSLVERSQRRLDVVEFINLANALNMEADDLFSDLLTRLAEREKHDERDG